MPNLLTTSIILALLTAGDPVTPAAQRRTAQALSKAGASEQAAEAWLVLADMDKRQRMEALDQAHVNLTAAFVYHSDPQMLCRALELAETVVRDNEFDSELQAKIWRDHTIYDAKDLEAHAKKTRQGNCRFDATGNAIAKLESTQATPKVAMLTDADFDPPSLPPVTAVPESAPQPAPPPRAEIPTANHRPTRPRRGVGLMVAGGVAIGTAAALLPWAVHSGRSSRARYGELLDLHHEVTVPSDADRALHDDLAQRYEHGYRKAVALSLTAVTLATTGVVLSTLGMHRAIKARASRRYSFTPAPRGVAFSWKF